MQYKCQKFIYLYLFTELFHKDFFSLIRTDCSYGISISSRTSFSVSDMKMLYLILSLV